MRARSGSQPQPRRAVAGVAAPPPMAKRIQLSRHGGPEVLEYADFTPAAPGPRESEEATPVAHQDVQHTIAYRCGVGLVDHRDP